MTIFLEILLVVLIYAIFVMLLMVGWYMKWAYMNFWRNPVGWTVIFKVYPSGKYIRGRVIDHHNRPYYPCYLVRCKTGLAERWVLKKNCWLYPFKTL